MKRDSAFSFQKTTLMHIMDTIGLGLFVAACAYLIFNWSSLPAEVPKYFGMSMEILQYESKWTLFLFPMITFLIMIALQILEKHPDRHYFPIDIKNSNIEKEVKQSVLMISFIKNMSSLLLAILVWETIHIAQGNNAILEGVIWSVVASIIIIPTLMTVIVALNEEKD